jgi:hypothetical protein
LTILTFLSFSQLMPSPKWKLVVDIGEAEQMTPPVNAGAQISAAVGGAQGQHVGSHGEHPDSTDVNGRDGRIDQVISLLGEYMPSDPASPIATYLPGFMSLRLMLLRPSKVPEEEDIVRTMLGSFSSYSSGGRAKSDIAVMLARDYMFLAQQPPQPQQQQLAPTYHNQRQSDSRNNLLQQNPQAPGYSFYSMGPGASSSNASFHNSPALAPIPMSGNAGDSVSIVST